MRLRLIEPWRAGAHFVDDLLARVNKPVSVRDTRKVQRRALSRPLGDYVDRYRERDDAIVAAYWSGSYTLQQFGDRCGVHYSHVSRIIRARRDVKANGDR